MQRRKFGKTGLEVSEISLGGLFFGKLGGGRSTLATVQKAADLGVNLIDTAPGYDGSEEALGEVFAKEPGLRRRFTLSTKWWAYEQDGKTLVKDPRRLREAVEGSLKRLRTERLDVLLFHSVTHPGDVEKLCDQALQAELEKLKREGKLGHVGLSNEGQWDPKDERLVEALGTGRFEVLMPEFLVFRQGPVKNLWPLSVEKQAAVIAITPLGQAAWGYGLRDRKTLLSSLELFIKKGELPDEPRYRSDKVLDFLLDAQTPTLAAAALRFCLSFPAISTVCCGTNDPGHLEENVAVCAAGPYEPERLAKVAELFGKLSAVPR